MVSILPPSTRRCGIDEQRQAEVQRVTDGLASGIRAQRLAFASIITVGIGGAIVMMVGTFVFGFWGGVLTAVASAIVLAVAVVRGEIVIARSRIAFDKAEAMMAQAEGSTDPDPEGSAS